MILNRFFELLQRSGTAQRQSLGPVGASEATELEGLEQHLSELQAELHGLIRAAEFLEPGAIPESLRRSREVAYPLSRISLSPKDPNPDQVNLDQAAAQSNLAALESRRENLRDLLALAENERQLFHQLLGLLHPTKPWHEAGERIRPLCQRQFELSGFYLARANWDTGEIQFPYFFDAGRPQSMNSIPLTAESGLTGWAIFKGTPCYLDSFEACAAHGMQLTEPEIQSGLYTKSWFGVPLPSSKPGRPLGLMGFHCFQAKAFSPDRQRLMTTVARITVLHLDLESVVPTSRG